MKWVRKKREEGDGVTYWIENKKYVSSLVGKPEDYRARITEKKHDKWQEIAFVGMVNPRSPEEFKRSTEQHIKQANKYKTWHEWK